MSRPLRLKCFAVVLALTAIAARSVDLRAEEKASVVKKPRVEVVFCLDTTGSMSGLIEGAKQKIWAISNQIASGRPTPELKVGVVAYRDRGDEYVTKVFDLTEDLDAVHGHLRGLTAAGGGDEPESVNQALHEAVTKIKWSADPKTMRILYLVGDAPPHMDYADDVKYPETCKQAVEKGIIVNTIQCGGNERTRPIWQDICVKAEGSYVQIAQDGGIVATIATPFDKRLAEINGELARSTLTFGRGERQAADRVKATTAAALPAAAQAERAGFSAKAGKAASYDLLDNLKAGSVKLSELKREELPEQLRKLDGKQQQEYLDKLEKQRTAFNKEALELDKKRAAYIAEKQAATKGQARQGFDGQVLDILRKQAKKFEISY